MRTVLIQRPSYVWQVLVQGYQDGGRAMSELLEGPSQTAQERHWARLIEALTQAVGFEYGAASGKGWATLWTSNTVEETELGEQHWRTWISVDDEQCGERTIGALFRALEELDIPFDARAHPVSLPLESHPVHARWGKWSFGPQRGSIEAELRPEKGVNGVELLKETPLPPLTCLQCGATTSPLPRILGYPSPEGELGVELGELAYGTCVLGEPMATAECGACGEGLVPGSADEEEAVTAAAGALAGPTRVQRYRRLFRSARNPTLVWTPFAPESRGRWRFHLSTSVREQLIRSKSAMLALRPRGLPVLFVQWQQIMAKIGDREPRRLVLTVSRDEPSVVTAAAYRTAATISPPRNSSLDTAGASQRRS